MSLLEVDDYPGLESPHGKRTVRLEGGQLLFVRGDSGAGKTRFLRRLIDLDPEPVGRIRVDGQPIRDIPSAELRRRLAYLPQDPFRFPSTGRALLERIRALRANRDRCAPLSQVESLCADLDVGQLLDHPMSQYSGGENRRFTLVCLLQLQPAMLLLDEPTTGLDERRTLAVTRVIEKSQRAGTAVLWVAHDGTPPAGAGSIWIRRS